MVRIVKSNHSKKEKLTTNLILISITVILISLFLVLNGQNPIIIFFTMLKGSFGNEYRMISTIKYAIPLVTTAIGLSVAFKMKFWNIGGEGQIIMGAIFATYFALFHQDLPRFVLLLIMLVASIIGGALFGIIPAILKIRFNTNETIVTLMMNYVALSLVTYLQYQAWKDPVGFPKIASFTENALLPKLLGIHIGWIFMIIIGIGIYYFINYSKRGYEVVVIGESINTAKYAGINIKFNTILVMIISGGICGLVGFLQAAGNVNTLTIDITMGVGNTAIIIAWLANLKIPKIFIVGFLFAIMTQGGYFVQSANDLHYNAVGVIQAIILFSALVISFFANYKIVNKEVL
ncbi:MAG: rbsC [Haloplasmataceae bacterium]|jgi:simple sugar transport system permease protein|nr:rbsC [Haloplasmataceae bacterium]